MLRSIAILIPLLAGTLCAQFETSTVLGTVRDRTGAVVPGALVTLQNVATGIKATTKTDAGGDYEIFNVKIGEYVSTAAAPGFATSATRQFTVTVNARQRVDLTLEVSTTTETIVVSGNAVAVESDTSDRGQVVGANEIVNIPLNGRSYADLALLAPGVSSSLLNGDRDGSFNVNGMRSSLNNFALDGVDNNAYGTSNQGFSNQVIQASPDALAEFKVQTNNYSAEFGRAGGAVINASMRSGANRFHGTVYEFLRNTDLNAVGFFKPLGNSKPVLIQNQFGFTAGGPIRHDRTFFFLSYEGYRRISRTLTRSTIPTLEMDQGNIGIPVKNPFTNEVFADGVIPRSQITPFARLVLSQLPAPNKPGYANNFESLPRRRDANDKGDAKFDHHFSDQVSAFVRLSQRKANNFEPPSIPGPSGGSSNGFVRQINQQLAGGVTYVPGVASLLEVRLGISRTIAGKTPLANGGPGMLELYGIPGTPTDASIAGGLNSQKISGFTDFGRQNSNPQFQNPFVINPRINYSKVISRHSVKAGYEYQSVNTDIDDFHPKYGEDDYTGQFSRVPLGTFPLPAGYNTGAGYNLADFLFGARSKYSITNTTVIHLRQRMHFGYLQDDYRVNRKLTLNLGLRYEFATPQWERDNRLSNFDPATNTLIAAKDGSLFDRSRVHPDRNNFAPRLGLAFSITPKTVIRSAYGISYIHFNRLGGENLLSYNGPTIVTIEVNQLTSQPLCSATSNPLTCFSPTQLGYQKDLAVPANYSPLSSRVNYIPADTRTGYVQSWHFSIQRELARKLVFDVAYVGNRGVKLVTLGDFNQARPNASGENTLLQLRRPIPGYSFVQEAFNGGFSTYHALQVKLERRYSAGLYLLNSFTWSKSIDNVAGHLEAFNGDGSRINIRNPSLEKAVSSYDVPFNNTTTLTYELPFGRGRKHLKSLPALVDAVAGGWRTSLINTMTAGRPITITYSPSAAGQVSTVVTYRPNLIGDPKVPEGQRNENRYLDRAAFTTPHASQPFGTAGRNITRTDSFYQSDLGVHKQFRFGSERIPKLEFRSEIFNLLNKTNFRAPASSISSANFGTITSTAPARQIQFALKLLF